MLHIASAILDKVRGRREPDKPFAVKQRWGAKSN